MRISDLSSDLCSSDLLIAYRTALLGGGFGMAFVTAGYFFGDNLLHALIGKEFVAAAPVLTLMLLASTFDLISSSLRSAAYAIGHAGKVLRIYALSAGIFQIGRASCRERVFQYV